MATANITSSLLNYDENQLVLDVLGSQRQIIAIGVVQMYQASSSGTPTWTKFKSGVVCLVKDITLGSYFLLLVDLNAETVVFYLELYDSFVYKRPSPYFHTFQEDHCMVGLNFADTNEAETFAQAVEDKLSPTHHRTKCMVSPAQVLEQDDCTKDYNDLLEADRTKPRGPITGKLTKADISPPKNFRHLYHVGWDLKPGDFNEENYVGNTEEELKDPETAEFINNFAKCGGIKEATGETEQVSSQKKPPPTSQVEIIAGHPTHNNHNQFQPKGQQLDLTQTALPCKILNAQQLELPPLPPKRSNRKKSYTARSDVCPDRFSLPPLLPPTGGLLSTSGSVSQLPGAPTLSPPPITGGPPHPARSVSNSSVSMPPWSCNPRVLLPLTQPSIGGYPPPRPTARLGSRTTRPSMPLLPTSIESLSRSIGRPTPNGQSETQTPRVPLPPPLPPGPRPTKSKSRISRASMPLPPTPTKGIAHPLGGPAPTGQSGSQNSRVTLLPPIPPNGGPSSLVRSESRTTRSSMPLPPTPIERVLLPIRELPPSRQSNPRPANVPLPPCPPPIAQSGSQNPRASMSLPQTLIEGPSPLIKKPPPTAPLGSRTLTVKLSLPPPPTGGLCPSQSGFETLKTKIPPPLSNKKGHQTLSSGTSGRPPPLPPKGGKKS